MRLCLFIALSITEIFAQQDSLTLSGAVAIVLKRHPSITQAREALMAAAEHTRGLQSSFLPTVSADASYVNIGPDNPLTFPNLGTFKFFPENGLDAHLSVAYTVYDFGKRAVSVETGRIAEAASSDALRSAQTMLSYKVVQIFNAILLLSQSVEVANEEITELDRHLSIVKKRLETGSATEYDAVKTETQRASAQGRRIETNNDLLKMRTALYGLLGIGYGKPLEVQGGFPTKIAALNADSLVASAMKNRMDMINAIHKKESAHILCKNAALENAPVLGIAATAGVKNGIMPDIEKLELNWTAGARLSVPLYDGNRAASHKLETQRGEAAADATIADTRERITTEVLQAKADMDAAFARLDVSSAQVKFAQRTLILAHLKFEAGVITNNDVLDAENDFSHARLDDVQNAYRFTESLNALDLATGAPPRLN